MNDKEEKQRTLRAISLAFAPGARPRLIPFDLTIKTGARGRPRYFLPHWISDSSAALNDDLRTGIDWRTVAVLSSRTVARREEAIAQNKHDLRAKLERFADDILKHSASRAADIIKSKAPDSFADCSTRTLRRHIAAFKKAGQVT